MITHSANMISFASRESCMSSSFFEDSSNSVLFADDYHYDTFGLTPPQSPEQEVDCLYLTDYNVNSSTESQCECRYPIVRDCMWSANLAVRLPDPNGRLNSTDKSDDSPSSNFSSPLESCRKSNVCSRCVGLEAALECVDTSSIFNYSHVAPRIVSSTLCSSRSVLGTQIKEEIVHGEHLFSNTSSNFGIEEQSSQYDMSFGSLYSSDDDCEVDVENISDATCDDLIPSICFSVNKRSVLLPSAESASAQVAAMHNYSTSHTRPSVPPQKLSRVELSQTSRFRTFGGTTSAPQSPTTCATTTTKGRRCGASNPSSPNPRRYKRGVVSKRRYLNRSEVNILPTPPGSSDSEGELNKRAQHNVLERKRRNHLKEYFSVLRDQVPSLRIDQRSSKVVILQRAREWVDELSVAERSHQTELQRLKCYRDQLMRRIAAAQQRTLQSN